MAIIIRKNKYTARVSRQVYVRKNSEGNPYPFTRMQSIGQISLDATEVPKIFEKELTSKELERLIDVIIKPAREAKALAQQEEQQREQDPTWRLREAIKLMDEAAALTTGTLSSKLGDEVEASFSKLRFQKVSASNATSSNHDDPIDKATQATRLAKDAIKNGYYGEASEGPVSKNTPVYKRWANFRSEALDGDDSLLAALQAKRWVMKRG